MKTVSSTELKAFKSLNVISNAEVILTNVNPAESANSQSLVFISTLQALETAISKNVQAFIILEKFYTDATPVLEKINIKNKFIATTQNIHWAMSEILFLFDPNKNQTPTIHSTALISPKVKIGNHVSIGAYCVIEDFAVIEDFVKIGSHTVIEHHAIIKENSNLSSHVFVGSFTEIGKNCILAAHVVLGSDGFGYFTDKNFKHHKIAQIGKVVLEDNVEIGALSVVDRATLTETRIKSGSKLDNHCHVAHNCEIGENAAIAAGFIVAGSTKIGKNFMASGGVGVLGHLNIADHVILTARSGALSSIDKPGLYGGFPAIEQKENLKVLATLPHLPKIRKQISQIMKHLGLEK